MKEIIFLFLLLLTGCGRQAKLDSARLEGLLSGGQIDRIEVIIPFSRTNVLTGPAVQNYAFSLRETNRISKPDSTKNQVASEVALMRGTNVLGWLSQFEDGLWKHGEYSFRLRTSR